MFQIAAAMALLIFSAGFIAVGIIFALAALRQADAQKLFALTDSKRASLDDNTWQALSARISNVAAGAEELDDELIAVRGDISQHEDVLHVIVALMLTHVGDELMKAAEKFEADPTNIEGVVEFIKAIAEANPVPKEEPAQRPKKRAA